MKTAKLTPAAYYMDCPECGEGVPDDYGSLMWAEATSSAKGNVTECVNGHKVRIPRRFRSTQEAV